MIQRDKLEMYLPNRFSRLVWHCHLPCNLEVHWKEVHTHLWAGASWIMSVISDIMVVLYQNLATIVLTMIYMFVFSLSLGPFMWIYKEETLDAYG